MKGVIFTTFLELVEAKWGFDMVDDIIESSDLESGGVYTSVGTYDHVEAVNLVKALSEKTGVEVGALLTAFGEHLFGVLIRAHPEFWSGLSIL